MRNLLDIWNPERSNPFREFGTLQRRMDRFFDDFANSTPTVEFRKDLDFIPACDFEETDKKYSISLDVPGMSKDQLQVELSGNTLTISGEKNEEKTEGRGAGRSFERFHGRFERSFTLPHASETDKAEADYKDGVLRLSIPKSETAKAKTRKIQIGEEKATLFGKPARTEERPEEKKAQKPNEKAA